MLSKTKNIPQISRVRTWRCNQLIDNMLVCCLFVCSQTDLPALVLQKIAQQVAILGPQHFNSLRSCHREWKRICNAEVTSSAVSADQLTAAVISLNKLPNLKALTITGSNNKASAIRKQALFELRAHLSSLRLLSGSNLEQSSKPKMVISNLGIIMTPWRQSLRILHISNCCLPAKQRNTLHSPSFLSDFPNLSVLRLMGVHTKPARPAIGLTGCAALRELECIDSNPRLNFLNVTLCNALTLLNVEANNLKVLDLSACACLVSLNCKNNSVRLLNVSFCKKLRTLDCSDNRLIALEASACSSLEQVIISYNHLQTLDLSPCPKLASVDCCANVLRTLLLPQHNLNKLSCAGNSNDLIISGCKMLLILRCDVAAFVVLSQCLRRHMQTVHLVEGMVTEELGGFCDLKTLSCQIGATGSIDLANCTAVELNVLLRGPAAIKGCDAVQKLTVFGACLHDLPTYTSLEELHYSLQGEETQLDLSWSSRLRKVHVSSRWYNRSFSTLIGCPSLEELEIDCQASRLDNQRELDLSLHMCKALKHLKCVYTGIRSLDVSCCPLLTHLDVSSSVHLQKICTRGCLHLLNIKSDGFPRLVL